jgi:hypothetical protein
MPVYVQPSNEVNPGLWAALSNLGNMVKKGAPERPQCDVFSRSVTEMPGECELHPSRLDCKQHDEDFGGDATTEAPVVSREAQHFHDFPSENEELRTEEFSCVSLGSSVKSLLRKRSDKDPQAPQYSKFTPEDAKSLISKARAIEAKTWLARKESNAEKRSAGVDARVRGGLLGKAALKIYESILFVIWPKCREVMQPSVTYIAEISGYSKRTVFRALAILRRLGLLWYDRGAMHKSVAEDGTTTWRRETSKYIPTLRGLAKLGADVCAWASERWCQFGTGIENLLLSEATASETDGFSRAPP